MKYAQTAALLIEFEKETEHRKFVEDFWPSDDIIPCTKTGQEITERLLKIKKLIEGSK